ncbi:MAG: penicillin-binding protein [Bacteroidota bacterium]|nr:penicillin-binding protein [Bacteroidota bacterium]
MNIKKQILWRVYIAFGLIVFGFLAVLFRIGQLQTVKRGYLQKMSDSLDVKIENIPPIRGNIYAVDGSLLATSVPIYEARFDATLLKQKDWNSQIDSLCFELASFFPDKSVMTWKNDLTQARQNHNRYLLLQRGLTHTQISEMKKMPIFKLGRYKSGLRTEQKNRRIHPFNQLCYRTIGYLSDGSSPVGLEGAFNYYLNGKIGKRRVQKVPGNIWIPITEENEQDPIDGQDVYTTLDVNFQDITENALRHGLVTNNARYGCAIVMETANGNIKAIANLSQNTDGTFSEDYNYAIGRVMEPGSTFKLVSIMALLDHKMATSKTIIDANGGEIQYYGQSMHDSKLGLNEVSLEDAFALSSNVAISKLVNEKYGKYPERFTSYISQLKLNQPIGLHLLGEKKPYIKSPSDPSWSRVTLPWMSVGYELEISPLQILTLYNAVANNGVMVKPRFVTEVRDAGQLVKSFPIQVINQQICSPTTLKQVQKMLVDVVERGTANNIKSDLYQIAGKTGTTQISDDTTKYHQKVYRSSFCGYFPANKPAYTIFIVVSCPTNGNYYGSAVAAPIFKEISDRIYARTATTTNALAAFTTSPIHTLPLPKAINQVHLSKLTNVYADNKKLHVNPEQNNWVSPVVQYGNIKLNAYSTVSNQVPDVLNMTLTDAVYILENAGYKVRFSGKGKVKAQFPAGNQILQKGKTIEIKLYN